MQEVAGELAHMADVVGFGPRDVGKGFPGSEGRRAAPTC